MLRGSLSRWHPPPTARPRPSPPRTAGPRPRPARTSRRSRPARSRCGSSWPRKSCSSPGLIGSYIVLRAGSPHDGLQQPLSAHDAAQGTGEHARRPAQVGRRASPSSRAHPPDRRRPDRGRGRERRSTRHPARPGERAQARKGRGAARASSSRPAPTPRTSRSKTHKWPVPYDELTNPLAINLTAFNTFVLICSSVTMVLALAAIQDGKRGRGQRFSWPHRPDRQRLPEHPGLRILSIDGRPPLSRRASARPGISGPASACLPRASSR